MRSSVPRPPLGWLIARLRPALLGLLASGLALLWAAPALAQPAPGARLDPVGGSGVSGEVAISVQGDAATVTVVVIGLAPGASHPVRLHAGACVQVSASAGQLGVLTADAGGQAVLTATRVTASAAGTPVPLTASLLADGPRSIVVGGPAPLACGTIQGLAGPAAPGLPRAGAGGAAGVPGVTGLLLAAGGLGALAGGLAWRRRAGRAR